MLNNLRMGIFYWLLGHMLWLVPDDEPAILLWLSNIPPESLKGD
jgi:hypothetical protein